MKTIIRTLLILLLLGSTFIYWSGCGKKEEHEDAENRLRESMDISRKLPKGMRDALHGVSNNGQAEMPRRIMVPARVVVPKEIEGSWRAIVIGVTDKNKGKTNEYVVDLKSDFLIPDAGLKIQVQRFLPDFSMSSGEITSLSNEPRNPAAQVVISKDDKVIFESWLFKLYPEIHAFQHPRYTIVLKDHIRASR